MSALLHFSPSLNGQRNICIDLEQLKTVGQLTNWIHDQLSVNTEFKLVHTGRFVHENDQLQANGIYHFAIPLCGGKGGFGSMLRAIGAQIEKTTNREACRDLSGRRMRDVNNEKKLKDWISKKADREQERERVRRERLSRRLAEPKHKFDDPNYETQKSQAADSLEDALQAGLNKSKATATVTSQTQRKRHIVEEADAGPSQCKTSRKSLEWMGVEGGSDLDSDLSASEEHSDSEENPSSSNTKCSSVLGSADPITPKTDGDNVEANGPTMYESHSAQSSSLLAQLPPPSSVTEPVAEINRTAETIDPASVNLEDYGTVEELKKLGLNLLKSVLMLRGLKCGGTLQERAERLFSVKGLNKDEISPSLLAKLPKGKSEKKKK